MTRDPGRRLTVSTGLLAAALTVMASLAAGATAARAGQVLELDPAATTVTWTLGSTFHEVHGTFAFGQGSIRFDPDTGEASGRIEIPAATGESGNKSRDRKMHKDVLESAKYPLIVFTPEKIGGSFDPATGGNVSLEGFIELHGVRKPITLEGDVTVAEGRLTGTARMTIPYVEWGMKDPSAFIFRAEKSVEIALELDGTLQPDTTVMAASAEGP